MICLIRSISDVAGTAQAAKATYFAVRSLALIWRFLFCFAITFLLSTFIIITRIRTKVNTFTNFSCTKKALPATARKAIIRIESTCLSDFLLCYFGVYPPPCTYLAGRYTLLATWKKFSLPMRTTLDHIHALPALNLRLLLAICLPVLSTAITP